VGQAPDLSSRFPAALDQREQPGERTAVTTAGGGEQLAGVV
jgi:hypothetical protein